MNQTLGYASPEYLHVLADKVQHIKQRSYEYMHIKAGQTLLDVGCGPGTDTISLAHLVGLSGHIIGVDFDPGMVAEADRCAEQTCLAAQITHKLADASSLPFGAQEFDACRSERLFQHLQYPEQVLSEMARVTKRGGWIVVVDTDWGTASTDTTEIDIERRLARFGADHQQRNGYSGRRLYRQFKEQHLGEISMEMFPLILTDYSLARDIGEMDEDEKEAVKAGVVTEDEIRRWRSDLEQADTEGMFFTSCSMILAAGRNI